VRFVKWNVGLSGMISELELNRLAERVDDGLSTAVTVSLRPKPNSDKSLMIFMLLS